MFSANENIQLRKHKRQIVEWVEEKCLPPSVLDLGCNVMVMQVQCTVPGCAPVETVLMILFPQSPTELLPGLSCSKQGGTYKTKILKPMSQVQLQDIYDALPPQFPNGTKSTEKLYLRARDIMLGQITQLFEEDDTESKQLLARYLQQSLQDYMNHDCQPPEWGEPHETAVPSTTTNNDRNIHSDDKNNGSIKKEDSGSQEKVAAVVVKRIPDSGNIVIQRPVDDDVSNKTDVSNKYSSPNNDNNNNNSADLGNNTTIISSSSTTPTSSLVHSSTRQRQQHQATIILKNNMGTPFLGSSATLLSQLAARENHAPGVRRAGCPCCDPDNPSNIVDQMMMM